MSTFNEEELTDTQLQRRGEHFAKGLAILWNEPKKRVREQRELLTENRPVKRYALRKREKARKERRTPVLTLWDLCTDEALHDTTTPSTNATSFTEAHNTKVSETVHQSQLQQQLLVNNRPVWTTAMKRFFRAIAILEYEHDYGLLTDKPFEVTMIGESVWTPNEKKRFFIALDRCGKHNVEDIARRVGPTKTVAEVHAYLHFLDVAARAIAATNNKKIQHPFAREMSVNFIMQEERLAQHIQRALEVESYEKHLKLCSAAADVQRANEFFELWNMSSLTRLFAGQSDLTVLCSTIFNYYQLVKKFVQDIMVDLYTQLLLDSTDMTVSTSLVNYVVAKKRKFNDVRFRELDVMSAVGGRSRHGSIAAPRWSTKYSRNRSISFLAKRRRLARDTDEPDDDSPLMEADEDDVDEEQEETKGVIVLDDSESELEEEEQEEEQEEEEGDPMFEDMDSEDELQGQYVVEDFDAEHEQEVKDLMDNTITEETVSFNNNNGEDDDDIISIIDSMALEECIAEEEEEEEEMKELDALDEEQLSEYLGFYTTQQIADAHLIGTPTQRHQQES